MLSLQSLSAVAAVVLSVAHAVTAAPDGLWQHGEHDEHVQSPFTPPSQTAGKRILIIGAGTAGVSTLKALLVDLPEESRKGWEVTLLEQRSGAGGVWLADNITHPDPRELPDTPLYPDLVTNTPHPIMTIPRFPFRPETPLFPKHTLVRQYHDDILSHFNLSSHVRYNTRVVETRWEHGRWIVNAEEDGGVGRLSEFDHLIVANGHFHYPSEPVFEGRDDWENAASGRVIFHSIYFRNASSFAGKNVLVVGGSASGQDVARHALKYANSTTIAVKQVPYKDRNAQLEIPGVDRKPGLARLTSEAVIFSDGSQLSNIDIIVLATGYELRVPFLTRGDVVEKDDHGHPGTGLTNNGRYIRPVWRHIFPLHPELPPTALTFVGLPIFVNNGPNSFAAGLFIGHAIANPSILPTRADMLQEVQDRESAMRAAGLDPGYVGHRLIALPGEEEPAGLHYSNGLIKYLQDRGLAGVGGVPPAGRNYTEPWRYRCTQDAPLLRKAWQRIVASGDEAVKKWVSGAQSEQDWAELTDRMVEWERENEKSVDEDFVEAQLADYYVEY